MPEKLRRALLATLVAVYLLMGAAYAIKTPAWETPDEPAHFNYVRHLATRLEFPELKVGDYDQAYLAEVKASKFASGKSIDSVRYESWQPPLYYLLSVPIYWGGQSLPQAQLVVLLRLFSVLLGGVVLLVSYRITRQVFPKDDQLALAVPGFIATLPQHLAITASVSNDTLAELILSLVLLVMVKRISSQREGIQASPGEGTWRQALTLGALLGLALLTKSTIYVAVVLVPVALLLEKYGRSSQLAPGKARQSLRIFTVVTESAVIFAVALALSGWWFVRNAWVYGGLDLFAWTRHDLVVQGQPLTGSFNLAYAKFFALTTFRSFWAQFGWMGVLADERTYLLLGILTAAGFGGLVLFLLRTVRLRQSFSPTQRSSLLLMGVTFVLVLGVLLFYNFHFIQAQGRYLFPALIPIAFFFVLGLREIMSPLYAFLLFALLYLALLTLDYISLTRFILPQLAG
ncbi:MAG: glycosyltransferase family 39 protein [Chloroflexi bacterium]|nr:glycosyltransferase family 39 protein [Chloroflexota bacterium]